MSRLVHWLAGGALALALAAPVAAAELSVAEAAGRHDVATVGALLKAGAAVNEPDEDGQTALAWAAQYGDAALAETLLKAGADPNVANEYGVGPLLIAAGLGDVAVSRLLLAGGADPNGAMWNGETALMHAARAGSVEVTEALLKAGARVDAREERDGQTALMWAAAAGRAEVVRTLLAAKADRSIRTPVLDIEYPDLRELNTGVLPPRIEKKGAFTAFLFAVQSGDEATVKVLLDAGEDPNQSAADGVTGLLLSAYRHESFQHDFPLLTQVVADLEMVDLLLAAGADPNKAETHGLTPLHTAVFVAHGHDLLGLGGPRGEPNDEAGAALTAKLLARGADPNLEIRDYLVPSPQGQDTRAGARYANISAILLASVFGKTKLVDLMVDSGRVDVARRLSNGSTPLISAARLNSLTGVRAFIRAGADVHAADSKGDTALHLVARGGAGTGPIAEALIEAGARVDAKNAAGRTPVDIATVEGSGAGPAAGPPRNRGAPVGVDPAVQAGGVQAGRGPEAGPVILQAAAGPQTGRASAANARRLGAPAAK